jgi:hypothetical protein
MEDRYTLGYTYGALDVYRIIVMMLSKENPTKEEIVERIERFLKARNIVPTM